MNQWTSMTPHLKQNNASYSEPPHTHTHRTEASWGGASEWSMFLGHVGIYDSCLSRWMSGPWTLRASEWCQVLTQHNSCGLHNSATSWHKYDTPLKVTPQVMSLISEGLAQLLTPLTSWHNPKSQIHLGLASFSSTLRMTFWQRAYSTPPSWFSWLVR